jgi:hypothetical protein
VGWTFIFLVFTLLVAAIFGEEEVFKIQDKQNGKVDVHFGRSCGSVA